METERPIPVDPPDAEADSGRDETTGSSPIDPPDNQGGGGSTTDSDS
jgi:hypothetical protein